MQINIEDIDCGLQISMQSLDKCNNFFDIHGIMPLIIDSNAFYSEFTQ